MKRCAFVLLCVAVMQLTSSHSQAAIQNPANFHWYDIVSSGANGSWTNAENNAIASGGHLVTINDAAEESWLRTNFGSTTRFWIGFNDAATEGTWLWANGETPVYTNWASGEPNNATLPTYGEDYAVLNWNASGEWNDWDHMRGDYTNISGIAEFTRNPDVPEPSTCAIWSLLGAIGMTSWRRNRRRASAA